MIGALQMSGIFTLWKLKCFFPFFYFGLTQSEFSVGLKGTKPQLVSTGTFFKIKDFEENPISIHSQNQSSNGLGWDETWKTSIS